MDIPVKKLSRLLKPDQPPEVRAAALIVLSELGIKEADTTIEILQRLEDEAEEVRKEAIRATGKLKITKALPTLFDRIRAGGEEAILSADAAAKLGESGVKGLQKLLHEVAPGLRRYIAAALTGAGSSGAEAGISVLIDKDPQIATAAATAIIGRIPSMPADRKQQLVEELTTVALNKKQNLPVSAELPIVRVLASLNDVRAATALWEWVIPPHAAEVRAAALQAVGGWIQNPNKEQWKRLFTCGADPDFRIAAPALMILDRLSPDKHIEEWIQLLAAPDVAARRLALEKVGNRDTSEVATAILAQLSHPDRGLQDAARTCLIKLEQGRKALIGAVLASTTVEAMWPLVRSVAPFVGSISEKLRAELFVRACDFLEEDDHRSDPILFLLRAHDAAAVRDQLFEQGVAKRKKKSYEGALKYFKLLIRDPAVGFPVRLELALCGLKLSTKEIAAESRNSDPCLRQFEHVVDQNSADVLKQIEKAKWLGIEELYYLGFHFAEKLAVEKDFGLAVLKLVVKLSPKSKLASAARNKIKSVA